MKITWQMKNSKCAAMAPTNAKEQYVTTLKSNFIIIYYSDQQTKQLFLGIKIL